MRILGRIKIGMTENLNQSLFPKREVLRVTQCGQLSGEFQLVSRPGNIDT